MPVRDHARSATSPANRSLERGLRILRVFRPGSSVLGNSEIADSTGLPRSTVSRLTQTLVACGFLQHDQRANAYRLGPPVLSLSEALLSSSELVSFSRPFMREMMDQLHVNVSLAIADQFEMVYLETIRHRNTGFTRRSSMGRRTPMELTAFGRAHLAALSPRDARLLMAEFKKRHAGNWKEINEDIAAAIADVSRKGYCIATWLQGVTAIATPIETSDHRLYVLGLSGPNELFEGEHFRDKVLPPFLKTAETLRMHKAA